MGVRGGEGQENTTSTTARLKPKEAPPGRLPFITSARGNSKTQVQTANLGHPARWFSLEVCESFRVQLNWKNSGLMVWATRPRSTWP